MSTEIVIFSNRLREELDRLDVSITAAAEAAGEKNSDRLRQVLTAKQRCPLELLSALEPCGVDVYYVLTGSRTAGSTVLTARESTLVENYRAAPEEAKKALETTSAALAQSPGALKKVR